ncbi:putative disease resistance RPP13-like protein 1 [Vitis riparia]|uniref:putative disease resistance RPP13-like protein 1 n=1 Tax=Vitis riparia TaxID=96939 RepID=UPI00155AF196|nr:putative disease resistance RPP13-like protein 1 [Vitis riparia]XP_034701163.1 putative disease resistance RPP13-like protein 1 [Vitis riparia]XP_034701164.1 putative disease resistance RPP13-like protein 1 [Vitis riparia]XP_034701165.1 putative disease resistance RPP13-like protein 1 [Vitis riparia]XP_034701166.1 putative disease resistance RPP13-like protein 1 [Vitis riparia]XP_034701167.1 putative disease resistance RPP13-like protein 1 [Vitis riparia]
MAGAVVGGALLSASLQVLFDRMASRDVLTFLREQELSATLLRNLQLKLLEVQAVLNDAEAKQITNSAVKDWVDELKDAVYDAEDLVDDITTEALRRKMEYDSQTQVRNIIFGEGIESRVEEITDTLEYLSLKKDVLGLKKGVGENLSKRWPTTSLVDESGVYGRDVNREEIVKFLLSQNASENKISVIALVGMGGIGKTTLTQLVYNDRRVDIYFDLKAWVCVSDEFDLVTITKTIVKAIDSGASDDNDLNLLQLKLKERLSGKKFLLVLDDVWNENFTDWDKLQTPFVVGLNRSKIIVTTRSNNVASVMHSDRIHHLGQLSFEDCWSLFAKQAFKNGDSSRHPKLEEIGKEIVKKCKGLPLAAKTLGGALYSELRIEEWENVLNSETWDLPKDEILPALRLSYSFLPSHLKQCFAYCSIFPKDYEFEKENLILLWMAEGFLEQSVGKKTMEKEGDEYFHDLVSRSFFQKSSSHKSYFVMHDLINDLARLVSGKFCVQLKDRKMNEISEKFRHLSYFRSRYDLFDRFNTLTNINGLRTFLPLNLDYSPRYHLMDKTLKNVHPYNYSVLPGFRLSNRVPNDLLSKIQYLRVLSLSYYRIIDLPDTIGNLKHLRYLDLSYTFIKRLPDSICSLYNLQTLILSFCRCLVELPVMMSKLIRLRHLDIRHSQVKEMPSQMGQLKSLQKLTNYRVGKKSGTRVGELRELSHICGILSIEELQNAVDGGDASEANLVGKRYLDDLQLEWNDGYGVEQNGADIVLNNLQPHSNLKRLTIHGYGGLRFPDWLEGPAILINMVSLRLWRCKNVSAFPPLGQLPSLKHLYINGAQEVETVGAEFYGTDSSSTKPSFVSLKALSFDYMPKWEKWLCLGGQGVEFPRLKELYIQYCPKLKGDLPNHLPLLTKLEIKECKRLVAPLPRVPAIRELTTRNKGRVSLMSPASDFICLESLITSDISQWTELPPVLQKLSIEKADSLESLLEEEILQSNTCLQDLTITKCSFSRTLRRVCLPITLKSLRIYESKNLELLLPEFFKCHFSLLERLDILDSTCNSLCFPLSLFPRLTRLRILRLKGLESLSFSISEGDPTSFDYLSVIECPNLVSIELPALNFSRSFIGHCKNLKSLLHKAPCFQSLALEGCPELIFPIQGLPSNLTSLSIIDSEKFRSQMELGLQGLTSLRHFSILSECEDLELFPKECLLPSTLTSLEISHLPNLRSLDSKGLQLLTSLQNLDVRNCPKLQSLTEEGLPTSLSFLTIENCPLLKERCNFGTGEDWHHIAHIPHILIDDQLLQ